MRSRPRPQEKSYRMKSCPFPNCAKEFHDKTGVRQHLATIFAAKGDPEHPGNSDIWGTIDFTYQRRTGQLSEQEQQVDCSDVANK